MNLYQSLFLLIIYWIAITDSYAQDYLFDLEVIGVEDGLPEREVFNMVEDKKGYLWLSTQGAISRYDGKQFKTYTYQQLNIDEYLPTSLTVDDQNNIWYQERGGSRHGGVINPITDSIYTIESYTKGLLNAQEIVNLNYAYQDDSKWFVTTQDGMIYAYENGKLQKIVDLKHKSLVPIYFEPSGKAESWVLQGNQAIRLQNYQPKDTFAIDETHLHFYRIIQQQPALIFESYNLATSGNKGYKFWTLKDNQILPYNIVDSTSFSRILLLEDNFNVFFVNDEIIIRDNHNRLLVRQKNPLGQPPSKCLYLRQQDILFLDSANGILKITRRKNPFQVFKMGRSIWGLYPQKIEEDWLRKLLEEEPNINFPKSFKGTNNQLWIGTNTNKLIAYQANQPVVIYESKNQEQLWMPFENNKTNKIWVGTNKGLLYLDAPTKEFVRFELPNINKNIAVRHFHQNDKGIWILTSEGIFLMDAHSETIIKQYTQADGLPNQNFMHLHEDKEGVFWLATKGGGLIRWDIPKNAIKQFTQEEGLSHNVLYAVYEDDYENLWLPSNYGLMQFNKSTSTTRVYLPQNGIPHEEFNTFEHAQAADGTLYLGGLGEAIAFHPKDIHQDVNIFTPPLHLSSVKILEGTAEKFKDITRDYLEINAVVLDHDYQTLELELSLLDYESTEDIQYAYQIEGYQDQWTYTKENTISIFKLPYGDYQVKLKARGAAGVWTNKIITFPLTIKTPFYLQTWFLISLSVLFILSVLGFIKRREINLQKDRERLELEVKKRTATIAAQTAELKLLDKAKTRFFSNITHEFRTPLTLIIGPLEQYLERQSANNQPQKLFGILKNAKHLLGLINQLLDMSKLEGGKMQVEVSHGEIIGYTQDLLERFQPVANEKNQRLVFQTQLPEWTTHFDKKKWSKILYNVLSNAIKFTPENGAIQLLLARAIQDDQDWIHLKISDSGIGLSEEQIPRIFDRFYQIDDSATRHQEGTGIGLALVKELVELQGGKIKVLSQIHLGTTFDIRIPVSDKSAVSAEVDNEFQPSSLMPIIAVSKRTTKPTVIQTAQLSKKLQLLIIEDNQEMSAYIESCLEEQDYNITKAFNGLEGTEKAQALIPDLIISDVMMPKKDGFEVTQTIRQEVSTSHIPIILLSARAALDSKLKGLERGADAYLTKPFSPTELRLRIQKLIELRQALQKRYQNMDMSEENEVKATPFKKEDVFIKNIRRIIIENIEESNLNGDIVGKKYGISRMQLHRKLKALTNQSTSEFIQNIRLEQAYQLLQKKELNVTEVAYQTGFAHPNHFSRVFKKKYGKAPSKIVE